MTPRSPDLYAIGFLAHEVNPARYDTASSGPDDVAFKIAALLPRGAKVLDVGCGTGVISCLLQELSGCEITGIEPDEARVAIARGRGLKVHQGYLTERTAAELGRFDAVVFADVLEHLPDPGNLVIRAAAMLSPSGFVIASVPNAAHWTMRMDLFRGRFEYEDCGIMDATHLRWFTHDSLRGFFGRLGLEVTAMDQTVMAFLPAYSRRVPWRWLPGRIKRSVLRLLVRCFPRLFGCQIIVQATINSSTQPKD